MATSHDTCGLKTWVDSLVVPWVGRAGEGGGNWCSKWQSHPEAMLILEGLWRSHQQIVLGAYGGQLRPNASQFVARQLVPLLHQLVHEAGPFEYCSKDRCGGVRGFASEAVQERRRGGVSQ